MKPRTLARLWHTLLRALSRRCSPPCASGGCRSLVWLLEFHTRFSRSLAQKLHRHCPCTALLHTHPEARAKERQTDTEERIKNKQEHVRPCCSSVCVCGNGLFCPVTSKARSLKSPQRAVRPCCKPAPKASVPKGWVHVLWSEAALATFIFLSTY